MYVWVSINVCYTISNNIKKEENFWATHFDTNKTIRYRERLLYWIPIIEVRIKNEKFNPKIRRINHIKFNEDVECCWLVCFIFFCTSILHLHGGRDWIVCMLDAFSDEFWKIFIRNLLWEKMRISRHDCPSFWFLVWLNLVRIRFGKEMADFEKTWENSNTTKRNRKKERTLKIAWKVKK